MLPAPIRLTRREDFMTAVRRGRRAARRTLIVHLARSDDPDRLARVGFIVGRAVGGAVVRHRVQRQLRHLMRARLATLPAGSLIVVRALPAAAGVTSAVLGQDLDRALHRLRDPQAEAPGGPGHTLRPSPDQPLRCAGSVSSATVSSGTSPGPPSGAPATADHLITADSGGR